MGRESVYVSAEKAADAKAAKLLAKQLMGPGWKVSSSIWNRGRGGWTINFKNDS